MYTWLYLDNSRYIPLIYLNIYYSNITNSIYHLDDEYNTPYQPRI